MSATDKIPAPLSTSSAAAIAAAPPSLAAGKAKQRRAACSSAAASAELARQRRARAVSVGVRRSLRRRGRTIVRQQACKEGTERDIELGMAVEGGWVASLATLGSIPNELVEERWRTPARLRVAHHVTPFPQVCNIVAHKRTINSSNYIQGIITT